MPKFLVKLLATFFYVGYFPIASGSAATVAGVLLCLILSSNIWLYTTVMLATCIVGFIVSDVMERQVDQKDPGCIVIDEVAGVLIAFFLLPMTWEVIWITFFVFRAFDMFKIYPMNKLEMLPGGRGIMLDDIGAGIYTNLTMQVVIRLAGIV